MHWTNEDGPRAYTPPARNADEQPASRELKPEEKTRLSIAETTRPPQTEPTPF